MSRRVALLVVAVAAVLFGTAGVARGLGPAALPSTFVASWRAFGGGVALVVTGAAAGRAPWASPWRPGWTLVGGAAVVGYQVAFFAAADRIGVGPAAVVTIGTGPVVAGLLDRIVLRHPVHPRWVVGVTIALAGIVIIGAGDGAGAATGWGFAVFAGACYPVYGLAAQRLMADRTPLGAIATVFGAGAVVALPFVIATTVQARSAGVEVTGGSVGLVAYLALAATGLAYGLWAIGLSRLSLSDTVAVTLAEPVAAVVLAAALLDEPITATRAVGVAMVLAGVALATFGAAEPASAVS